MTATTRVPSNIEAEQSLLGCLLINNGALEHICYQFKSEHFCEPLHSRIFEAIHKFNEKGLIANAVTLSHYLDQDATLADIGGGAYLTKLSASATNIVNIADHSRMIYHLALIRQVYQRYQ